MDHKIQVPPVVSYVFNRASGECLPDTTSVIFKAVGFIAYVPEDTFNQAIRKQVSINVHRVQCTMYLSVVFLPQ